MKAKRNPFSNFISNIFFVTENSALFATWADMAVYNNGSFSMLPPLRAHFGVNKLESLNLASFWAQTGNGQLFFFNRGHYRNILNGKSVNDFCIAGKHDGLMVSLNETLLSLILFTAMAKNTEQARLKSAVG